MQTIYLDNAATSFPKPPAVASQMAHYMQHVGAPLNRSVYGPSAEVMQVACRLREQLATLLQYKGDPSHVVLTSGCTMALNMLLAGYLRPGDHCIVSAMEHNASMRPLMQLAKYGVSVSRIPANAEGEMQLEALPQLIRPNTKLILVTHASNVCGVLNPVLEISRIAQAHGIPFALDAAQTAGHCPVSFEELQLSAMAVPGHKGLLGPSGIGALLLSEAFAKKLTPIITGGTGSASDSEEMPPYMPDRLESGTLNIPGIYGLLAGVEHVLAATPEAIHKHAMALTGMLLSGIRQLPRVRLIGPHGLQNRVAVVSLDFVGMDTAEVADILAERYHIYTRCGLHCAPHAHKALGTFPQGTVRLSFGAFNTAEDVQAALQAMQEITVR